VSGRPLAVALTVAAVAALALTLSVRRDEAPARPRVPAAGPAALQQATAPPRTIDPRTLRDVFRFADEPVASARAEAEPGQAARPAADAEPASHPRLVGLVSRGDRLLAALAVGDEVLLLGPGETVAGITVVTLNGESVRVRRSDGTEQTLTPP
jgi:hypothetical protein